MRAEVVWSVNGIPFRRGTMPFTTVGAQYLMNVRTEELLVDMANALGRPAFSNDILMVELRTYRDSD